MIKKPIKKAPKPALKVKFVEDTELKIAKAPIATKSARKQVTTKSGKTTNVSKSGIALKKQELMNRRQTTDRNQAALKKVAPNLARKTGTPSGGIHNKNKTMKAQSQAILQAAPPGGPRQLRSR